MDETLEKLAGGFGIQGVKRIAVNLFAQLLDGFPVNPDVSQERRVKFGTFRGLGNEELRDRRVEHQLDPLKQNGVMDKEV